MDNYAILSDGIFRRKKAIEKLTEEQEDIPNRIDDLQTRSRAIDSEIEAEQNFINALEEQMKDVE